MMSSRVERLQIMLDSKELKALDDWRFQKRMPSRAAAVREIIRRGLVAEGFESAIAGQPSSSFGIVASDGAEASASNDRGKTASK
jgi:metal-responsive CopG/Arc/MetJ family transcriptional regulator